MTGSQAEAFHSGADGSRGGAVTTGATLLQELAALSERLRGFANEIDNMEEVAAQVNILAINAAIEAAHAVSQAQNLKEKILDEQMTTQARLLRELLNHRVFENTPYWWQRLADRVKLDTITITDRAGAVVYANEAQKIGWVFPSDPAAQTYPFTRLIGHDDAFYCQPIMRRSIDDTLFKFVGVSRQDEPGIVQVGYRAETIARINISVNVFGFIAQEMSRLSDVISKSARSMGGSHQELLDELKLTLQRAQVVCASLEADGQGR